MIPARILVCGGRHLSEARRVVWKVLNAQHQQYPITCLINGGCHGADQLARNWAKKFGVTQETYPADWSKGRIAGPIRNQEMIDRGKPDLVIAFPGGKGTADMVRRAREAGIPVQEVEQ